MSRRNSCAQQCIYYFCNLIAAPKFSTYDSDQTTNIMPCHWQFRVSKKRLLLKILRCHLPGEPFVQWGCPFQNWSTVLPRILTSAIIWRGLAVGNYTSRYNCIWRKFHILAEKAGRPKSCSIQSITAYHMPIKVRFRRNFAVNSSSSHLSFI